MPSRSPATRLRQRIGRCRASSRRPPASCPRPSASPSASSTSPISSRISTRRWPKPARIKAGSRPPNRGGRAMVLLFDKRQSIPSPALAPGQEAFERSERIELTIGLVNNMPDSALKATERQFARLLSGAAGNARIDFRCFSLPSVGRSAAARAHIEKEYADIAELGRLKMDGLIVTGAEPNGCALPEENLWRELTDIIDWARTNTRSTIWSCLAAHAAVLHLDGV